MNPCSVCGLVHPHEKPFTNLIECVMALRQDRVRCMDIEAALREGEWSYYTVDGDPSCGFCWALPFDDEDEPGVHSDDCLFAKPAIRAAIGGRDGDLAVCPGCGHTEKACTCDEVME